MNSLRMYRRRLLCFALGMCIGTMAGHIAFAAIVKPRLVYSIVVLPTKMTINTWTGYTQPPK